MRMTMRAWVGRCARMVARGRGDGWIELTPFAIRSITNRCTNLTTTTTTFVRTLHTRIPNRNIPIGGSNPSCSSTPPTAPPSTTSSPSSFTGLGTTQLSPDIMLRCTIFDSTGSATSTSGVFKKSRLCSDHGLEPRDLRKIDSRVPNLVPTILARRVGILVNILHIRAMIKKDKVLLFDSYGSTDSQLHSAFVYNLQHNLRPQSVAISASGHTGLAYEFRALESILVSVLDALRIELGVVRGWTSTVLEQLDEDVDRDKLRTLLQVSRKLNAFLSRAKAVKNAVVEVLENEEDMQLMYLSSSPPVSISTGCIDMREEVDGGGMDELELLLESFDKQVEEVVAETSQLHSDISNTQEVVELILDNNRNKLLALDLKTSIATMGLSAGTLWAGLFGMNLKSHMEELDWAFAAVSGVAFGAVLITAGVGLRRLERLRRVGLGQAKKPKTRVWLDRIRPTIGARKVDTSTSSAMGGWQSYTIPIPNTLPSNPLHNHATDTTLAHHNSTPPIHNHPFNQTPNPHLIPPNAHTSQPEASALGLASKWNKKRKTKPS